MLRICLQCVCVCVFLVVINASECLCVTSCQRATVWGLEGLPRLPSQHREQSKALFNPAECTSHICLPALQLIHSFCPLLQPLSCFLFFALLPDINMGFCHLHEGSRLLWISTPCFVFDFMLSSVAYLLSPPSLSLTAYRLHIPWGWFLHQMS